MLYGSLYTPPPLINHKEMNNLRWKRLGQTYRWTVPGNWRAYSVHFPPGFSLELPCKKTGTQSSNLCGAISSYSWNYLHCWVVELMIFLVEASVPTIAGTWYEYLFQIIVSVPPEEAELFPVLPRIIRSWFTFLRVCYIRKHPRIFGILQYFYLKSWFINFISWKCYNSSACISVL